MRLSLNWWVLPRATNYEEFVHCDFIDIARVFVLPDERPLVEGAIDVNVCAFLKFGREDRQIPVEDEAEPIGVVSRLVFAREAIGLSKSSIGNRHGGRQVAQRRFRFEITGELKAVFLHCSSLRIQIQAVKQTWGSLESRARRGCRLVDRRVCPRATARRSRQTAVWAWSRRWFRARCEVWEWVLGRKPSVVNGIKLCRRRDFSPGAQDGIKEIEHLRAVNRVVPGNKNQHIARGDYFFLIAAALFFRRTQAHDLVWCHQRTLDLVHVCADAVKDGRHPRS